MKALPSRLTIALLSAAISGLVLVAFGVVTWVLIYQMRLNAVDREIRVLASRHPGLFAGRGSYERLANWLEFSFGDDYTNHIALQIRDGSGRVLYSSPQDRAVFQSPEWEQHFNAGASSQSASSSTNSSEPHSSPAPSETARRGTGRGYGAAWGGPPSAVMFTKPPRFFTERTAGSTWRIGVLGNDEITLAIGLNQEEVEHELNHLRNAFLLTLPVALFLVGLGGWVVAGRALRPLKVIADTAERVTARGLEQRIPQTTESPEAAKLIEVLNGMMNRLEASFRQATRFSADASHELKTPLAIMQGELENALQAATPGSSEQQLFSNLLEETQRLKTITRSLLLLAQADAGQLKLSLATVNLSVELDSMIEDARVLATESQIAFELNIQPRVKIQADQPLLHTALFNLISNAVKYNEPGGRISIQLANAGDSTVFTIGNTGPGIPAPDQSKVFDRFFRVTKPNATGADGIGLGLSLAREIIRAHGGELALKESRAGWTCFVATVKTIGTD